MKSSQLDLNGKVLKVATNLNPPFVTFNDSNLPSGGFEITLLNELSNYFNFKFNLTDCKSNWGVLLPNNSWTGIIGKISRKEVDFGLSAITITLDRAKVVHFSQPHVHSSVTFITPPPKLGQSLELVLEPFETTVWICLTFGLILMIVNMWGLSQYYSQLKSISIKWFIVSVILKQNSVRHIPYQQPLRLMLCGWLLTCLVFIQTYGSRLYSLMAFPEEIRPINSVEQLASAQQTGEIQVFAAKRSFFYNLLKSADIGVYKSLGQLLEPIDDKEKGFQSVKQKGSKQNAFISTRANLVYGVLKIGKNYFHIPPDNDQSTVYFAHMAVPMQIGFPYIKHFDSFISHLKSSGLIEYWKLLEFRKIDLKFEMSLPSLKPFNSLRVIQFKSVLLMCLFTLIFSLFVFLNEILLDNSIVLKILFKLSLNRKSPVYQ